VEGRNKLSVSEYVAVFLKLHGLLHNSMDLEEAEKCVKVLMTTLTAHVATESLTSWKLVQVCSNFGKKKNSVAFSPQANYTD
jgi:protein SMG7